MISNLRRELQQGILKDKSVQLAMDREMKKHFDTAKRAMLAEFDSHTVTQGLKSHTGAGLVSRGSLFGFLGFAHGEDPTGALRDLLERVIIFKFSSESKRAGQRIYTVTIPSKDDVYGATPLPWAQGRSWVKAVEQGISGMGNYMNIDSPNSRSGEGIQSKTNKGGRFRNTSYISTILNNFKKRLLSSGITF